MNRALGILVIVGALILATLIGAILQPYTNFFAEKVADKDYPFNFKNEYELLIWQNEQQETKDVLISTLSQTNLKVDNEDEFAQCVIEKNLTSLRNLNSEDSKLNPIKPTTVAELGEAIAKFQPLLIEIQTKSVKSCLPEEQVDNRTEITLSCRCQNVELYDPLIPESLRPLFECGSVSGDFRPVIGVAINFAEEKIYMGGKQFPLVEHKEFYLGLDWLAWSEVSSKITDEQRSIFGKDSPFEETVYFQLKQQRAAAVKLERLTGAMEYNQFVGWTDSTKLHKFIDGNLFPHSTVYRQCSVAERF